LSQPSPTFVVLSPETRSSSLEFESFTVTLWPLCRSIRSFLVSLARLYSLISGLAGPAWQEAAVVQQLMGVEMFTRTNRPGLPAAAAQPPADGALLGGGGVHTSPHGHTSVQSPRLAGQPSPRLELHVG